MLDDHAIVRQGLLMLINCQPDLRVCNEAEGLEQAIEICRQHEHDLAIVDMSLAGASGLEVVKQFRLLFPALPILILSMHDEMVYAESALKLGAAGYLMKNMASNVLLSAIRKVLGGEHYLSDRMHARMLNKMLGNAQVSSPVDTLSPAELEVLHMIGIGLGTSEIAEQLARSIKTIESHKANIKKKLKLQSGNQLVMFAINMHASRAP